jgi:hypothetical protein
MDPTNPTHPELQNSSTRDCITMYGQSNSPEP